MPVRTSSDKERGDELIPSEVAVEKYKLYFVFLRNPDIPVQLTNHSGLQVNEDSSGDIFPGAGLTEEGGEGVVEGPTTFLAGHVAVRLDAVLQAVQLPAGVAHLDSSLANVDRDTLALWSRKKGIYICYYFSAFFILNPYDIAAFFSFLTAAKCINYH